MKTIINHSSAIIATASMIFSGVSAAIVYQIDISKKPLKFIVVDIVDNDVNRVQNAVIKITLYNDEVFKTETNEEGIASIKVRRSKIENGGTIVIKTPKYQTYKKEYKNFSNSLNLIILRKKALDKH